MLIQTKFRRRQGNFIVNVILQLINLQNRSLYAS